MSKKFDEILLLGSFNLIITEIFFYSDLYLWKYSQPLIFVKIIFITQVAFLLYLLGLIFADFKFFRNLVDEHTSLSYYLKSIGWISYGYIFGTILYLYNLTERDMTNVEDLFKNYPISLMLVVFSLVVAWARKHPRFLVE